jgi:type IV secretory pathway TraG/TraD family ATPase VirD4
LEDVLRNSLYLLLDTPRTSLMDVLTLISDRSYRGKLLRRCSNDVVRQFWEDEFEAKADKQKAEETRSTTNKVRAFLSNPYLADIIAGPSTLNIPYLMDHSKILILNLAKGSWGETPSKLLGCLFVIGFAQAAEERADIPEHQRRDFYFFIDEVQNFQNDALATILSESRKMRLSLTLANQFYAQLPHNLQAAISGNVGTWIAFRVGSKDAQHLAEELDHHNPRALSSTANYEAWVRTISNGVPTDPLPLRTFPPEQLQGHRLKAVRNCTRACHARTKVP